MGLSSALYVGRSAVQAYQSALQIVGNNIANAGTAGYTRLSPQLAAIPGAEFGGGQIGNGVRLQTVRRNVSESLQARLRTALSDREAAKTARGGLDRIENIFDPLSAHDLASEMSRFFNTVGDLQNTPEILAARTSVVATAQSLAQRFRDLRGSLIDLRTDLNRDIELATQQADQLATQIADLNTQITTAEAGGGGTAAALRNQRDQLLGALSEIVTITVREQPSGAVNVYVGNEALVQFGLTRGLKVTFDLDANGYASAVVRFKDDNGQATINGGQIAGLIASRDTHIVNLQSRLDTLAGALIQAVNKLHSGGQGLEGFTSLTGVTRAVDPAAVLTTANNGLPFLPTSGTFFIDVKDATGAVVRHQIIVDLDGIGADSTLNSIAADITANTPLTATVLADGRLQLTAPAGSSFTFAEDSSGFLAAMGLNTLLTGKDSSDIGVNGLIANNPRLLAASRSGLPGDGSNATAIAQLENSAQTSLGGVSLTEHYNATTSTIAVGASSAQSTLDAATVIFDSLTVQRESISGVNIDEEAVAMITYQRAFEGAARYMSVVDSMLQTLLSLVR